MLRLRLSTVRAVIKLTVQINLVMPLMNFAAEFCTGQKQYLESQFQNTNLVSQISFT